MERRKPLKRVAMKQGRQPLQARSKRTQADLGRRRKAKADVVERDQHCQALPVWPHRCATIMDAHEPRSRKRGGDPLDPDACILVCRLAHDHLHANPSWAESVGLLEPSRPSLKSKLLYQRKGA